MTSVNVEELDKAAIKPKTKFENFWNSRPIRKIRRNKLAVTGLIITLLFVLMSIFAPFIAQPSEGTNCLRDMGMTKTSEIWNPAKAHRFFWGTPDSCYQIERESYSPTPTPPAASAPFGTSNGYDIFYGMVWGTRTVFRMSFIIVLITLVSGIVIGAASGYYGGWIDTVIQRFIDVLWSLPGLVVTVVLITLLKTGNPGINPAMPIIVAYSVTGWTGYARMIRSEVLKTRQLEYVDAGRALGASNMRLILRHIVPNTLTSVITLAILDLGTIPLGVAALSFLGLGFQPGYAEWGQLVDFARAWLRDPNYWYTIAYPAGFIILFSLGFNLFGDALRDAYDPKTR